VTSFISHTNHNLLPTSVVLSHTHYCFLAIIPLLLSLTYQMASQVLPSPTQVGITLWPEICLLSSLHFSIQMPKRTRTIPVYILIHKNGL